MIKSYYYHEDFYDTAIYVLVGGTALDAQAFVKQAHGSAPLMNKFNEVGPLEDDTDGLQFHVNGSAGIGEAFYIWVHEPSKKLLDHEILHLMFDILHTRGIAYADECEDAFCYLGAKLQRLIAFG